MNKIEKLIDKLCPDGVAFKEIQELLKDKIISTISPPKKLTKKYYKNDGKFPIIDQGQNFIVGYTDDENAVVKKDQYVIFGDHTEAIKYIDFAFAVRIVNLYKYLCEEKKEYILSKQVLRSGTSIGANVEEAIGGQSDKDFLSKLSIAYKEARETIYWLKLLLETEYINREFANDILKDTEEICKIIGKIQTTMKKRINKS